MVGAYRVAQGSPTAQCRLRAGFWETATAAPVNLGVFLADVDRSQAEAVTPVDGGRFRVVGSEFSSPGGVYWQRVGSPGTWCGISFDSITLDDVNDTTPQCGEFSIRQALAVNQYGHVAGVFSRGTESTRRACALTCSGDLNEDFKVDAADRTILLAEYNAPCTGNCKADLDCDGDVDLDDAGILIAQWSGTSPCTVLWGCPEAGEGDSAGAGMSFSDALAEVGFTSFDAFVAWIAATDSTSIDEACGDIATFMNLN
jgi:hypothetical protein